MRFSQLVFKNGVYLSPVKTTYFKFLLLILFLWTDCVFASNKDTVPSNALLTQAHLLAIARQGEITQFAYDDAQYLDRKYRPYTISLHESQFMNGDEYDEMKYDGLLFAICDSGVFLSSRKMDFLRYYPYHTIQRIESGITVKRAIKRITRSSAAVGLVVGAVAGSGSISPINTVIVSGLGAVAGSLYGFVLSAYYLVGKFIYNKMSLTTSAMISGSPKKWMAFRKRTMDRGGYFKLIDISNFPLGDSALFPLPKAEKPEPHRPIVTIVDPNSLSQVEEVKAKVDTAVLAVSEHRDNPVTVTTRSEVVESPSFDLPAVEKTDWSQFNQGNGLASAWMYDGYQTNAVRVAYLAKQFAWIRQRTITDGDLAKLDTRSEVQFLAMWITTAAGYNFREVVSFNQEQVNFFQPKEPYLAETIAPRSMIDPQVLLDVDLENLKLLFAHLKH